MYFTSDMIRVGNPVLGLHGDGPVDILSWLHSIVLGFCTYEDEKKGWGVQNTWTAGITFPHYLRRTTK